MCAREATLARNAYLGGAFRTSFCLDVNAEGLWLYRRLRRLARFQCSVDAIFYS